MVSSTQSADSAQRATSGGGLMRRGGLLTFDGGGPIQLEGRRGTLGIFRRHLKTRDRANSLGRNPGGGAQ